jgi:hypothetical protein
MTEIAGRVVAERVSHSFDVLFSSLKGKTKGGKKKQKTR